jgi:hypothetical protein
MARKRPTDRNARAMKSAISLADANPLHCPKSLAFVALLIL